MCLAKCMTCVYALVMAPPQQEKARAHLAALGEQWKPVRQRYDELQPLVRDAVVAALDAGIQQKDIVELSGYTRENVRQIARTAELERARSAVRSTPRRTEG
jgi:hypothetical protein